MATLQAHVLQKISFWSNMNNFLFSYEYDCAGFVMHVLLKSSLQAHDELKRTFNIGPKYCPTIGSWKKFFDVIQKYFAFQQ